MTTKIVFWFTVVVLCFVLVLLLCNIFFDTPHLGKVGFACWLGAGILLGLALDYLHSSRRIQRARVDAEEYAMRTRLGE